MLLLCQLLDLYPHLDHIILNNISCENLSACLSTFTRRLCCDMCRHRRSGGRRRSGGLPSGGSLMATPAQSESAAEVDPRRSPAAPAAMQFLQIKMRGSKGQQRMLHSRCRLAQMPKLIQFSQGCSSRSYWLCVMRGCILFREEQDDCW